MLDALIAAFGLALACSIWFAVQRWASDDEVDGFERCGGCSCGGGGCQAQEAGETGEPR